MKRTMISTIIIVLHIVLIGGLYVFSGDGEKKAISKIAQPEVIKEEESRRQKQPTPIVQNPTKARPRITGPKKDFVNHIVQSGDYLSTIARKYKTSVNKIKIENHLKSDRIYVGQKLTIPQD